MFRALDLFLLTVTFTMGSRLMDALADARKTDTAAVAEALRDTATRRRKGQGQEGHGVLGACSAGGKCRDKEVQRAA